MSLRKDLCYCNCPIDPSTEGYSSGQFSMTSRTSEPVHFISRPYVSIE